MLTVHDVGVGWHVRHPDGREAVIIGSHDTYWTLALWGANAPQPTLPGKVVRGKYLRGDPSVYLDRILSQAASHLGVTPQELKGVLS